MTDFWHFLTLIGICALDSRIGIPLGIGWGVHPGLVFCAGWIGPSLITSPVILLGGRFRQWLVERYEQRQANRSASLVERLWHRYGVPGLGIVAAFSIGPPLGSALAISLGAPVRRVIFWFGLGIVLFSGFFTLFSALGWSGIKHLLEQ